MCRDGAGGCEESQRENASSPEAQTDLESVLGASTERDISFQHLCSSESIANASRSGLRGRGQLRRSVRGTTTTHSASFSISNIRSRLQKVLGRLLDPQHNIDVLRLGQHARACLQARINLFEDVKLGKEAADVSGGAQQAPEGLSRCSVRVGRGREVGSWWEGGEVGRDEGGEERSASGLGADYSDGVEPQWGIEVLVYLCSPPQGSVYSFL